MHLAVTMNNNGNHNFIYYYDRSTDKAKLVIDGQLHWVDDIITVGLTTVTQHSEGTPKFAVCGFCDKVLIAEEEKRIVATLI